MTQPDQTTSPDRYEEWTEREIHPRGDTPKGEGWVYVGGDGIDAEWERKRKTRVYW